jgi:D-lactate dehydrogenase (quinone)
MPLIAELRRIVGRRHVLSGPAATHFATGYRSGGGPVAAVIQPGSLVEQWQAFRACIAADHIVIPQAANTGLTGGSTPEGIYDRPVVIINTLRISQVHLIHGGKQVLCLSGSTLNDLEQVLGAVGREPHSVIGSSCIGASVVGGVCNNSGGALVARGPAYTEYALYAEVDDRGEIHLRNHLGLKSAASPEDMLRALEAGAFSDEDFIDDGRAASAASDYARIVRDVDASSAARFNSDPRRLFEASGSAGKVMVFAVRLDTFPRSAESAVFYIGTNDPDELTVLRRRFLAEGPALPVSGEYIHRDAFDIASRYGKDTVAAIRSLGTRRLPMLFRLKAAVDRIGERLGLGQSLSDRLLQAASYGLPQHLPPRLRDFRDRYEHHLVLKVADECIPFAQSLVAQLFPSEAGAAFKCTAQEEELAMLHRFAVAGAAIRYQAIHGSEVEDIVALDIALRRDDRDWFERLPPDLDEQLIAKVYYGHFFCHVLHQDYLVKKGSDCAEFKRRLLKIIEARGAEYPAEHNVGHQYKAKPALADHYRALDPGNRLNPGIGRTSRKRNWE